MNETLTNVAEQAEERALLTGSTVLMSLLAIALIVLFLVFTWRSQKKTMMKSRARDYMSSIKFAERTYSGNMTLMSNGVKYSRGGSSVIFPIQLGKVVNISPKNISEWFEERHYTTREEETILEDLQSFLLKSGAAKEVYIVNDPEVPDIDSED